MSLVIYISEMKLDDFYHEGFSDYCLYLYCYFQNVSADMSTALLQVFVKLRNLQGTSNYVLYWIHGVPCSDSVCYNRVQELSIPVLLLACSQDWTCNLQMIVSLEAEGTNAYNHYATCPAGFNKGRSSKFREGSRVWQTPEEGQRAYWPKCYGNNNKDEDHSPKTLNDKKTILGIRKVSYSSNSRKCKSKENLRQQYYLSSSQSPSLHTQREGGANTFRPRKPLQP